jgi:hypothetical protein
MAGRVSAHGQVASWVSNKDGRQRGRNLGRGDRDDEAKLNRLDESVWFSWRPLKEVGEVGGDCRGKSLYIMNLKAQLFIQEISKTSCLQLQMDL